MKYMLSVEPLRTTVSGVFFVKRDKKIICFFKKLNSQKLFDIANHHAFLTTIGMKAFLFCKRYFL